MENVLSHHPALPRNSKPLSQVRVQHAGWTCK